MGAKSESFRIAGWSAVAQEVSTRRDWSRWAGGELGLSSKLPRPDIPEIPSLMRRRLDTLGRCVMSVCVQCLPLIESEPAILAVSRRGNLPLLDDMIEACRASEGLSPTAFSYSVHNRLSSLVSMFASYRGASGASSSARDGFPLAIAEAADMLARKEAAEVLIIAYESEIPECYKSVIERPSPPHAAAFVLSGADGSGSVYSLLRHTEGGPGTPESGTSLPLIRCLLGQNSQRDGYWEFRSLEDE